MTKNSFSKFVAQEEKSLTDFCNSETDDFMLSKELILKDLALQVLKALDASKKADAFKSMLRSKSLYSTCGVSIACEYSWNEIFIYFITGSGINEYIKVHSDINNKQRYWHVIDYKTQTFRACYDIETLVKYLEDYPTVIKNTRD